jgi:NAD-dependent DNA ligase
MNILSLFTNSNKPSGIFTGKIVTFTGTLQSGNLKMLRAEAQQIVQALGGDIVIGESGREGDFFVPNKTTPPVHYFSIIFFWRAY